MAKSLKNLEVESKGKTSKHINRNLLDTVPWHSFLRDGEECLIKHMVKDGYSVLIVATFQVFYEELDLKAVRQRFKEQNPKVELPDSTKLLELLEHFSTLKEVHSMESLLDGGVLNLCVKSLVDNVILQWKFCLELDTPHMIYRELTLPMIALVKKLEFERSMLIEIIKEKDAEISDYRQNGGFLSLPSHKTKMFTDRIFDELPANVELVLADCDEKNSFRVFCSDDFFRLRSMLPTHESVPLHVDEGAKEFKDDKVDGKKLDAIGEHANPEKNSFDELEQTKKKLKSEEKPNIRLEKNKHKKDEEGDNKQCIVKKKKFNI